MTRIPLSMPQKGTTFSKTREIFTCQKVKYCDDTEKKRITAKGRYHETKESIKK